MIQKHCKILKTWYVPCYIGNYENLLQLQGNQIRKEKIPLLI
ncbi:Uncharacterized protein dnm_022490 [Desulfonema magnum]|uniref:Uncharacterized protein n=1 Tax=Desulfonema magnum TaxID=45655 RepID=A0A975BIZ8_9BACT|nr:Uncharacterized protein dnm_022490 [Desulfonema magnum]